MNPDSELAVPLTLDELAQLTVFLAERGDKDAIWAVVGRTIYEATMASLAEVTA